MRQDIRGAARPSTRRSPDALTDLVARAAAAILAIAPAALDTRPKADKSPVTAADEAADAVILAGSRAALPGVAVVSEESRERPSRARRDVRAGRSARRHQGIRQRARRIHRQCRDRRRRRADRRLRRGARARARSGAAWSAAAPSASASIAAAAPVADPLPPCPAGRSRRGGEPLAFRPPPPRRSSTAPASPRRISCGSALKFCRVAEGAADVYPRLRAISEWDIAAGHAVRHGRRRRGDDARGRAAALRQRGAGLHVPGFIAWGDPTRRIDAGCSMASGMRPLTTVGHLSSACRIASSGSAMKRARASALWKK